MAGTGRARKICKRSSVGMSDVVFGVRFGLDEKEPEE